MARQFLLTIKRSPVSIVKNFILLQLAGYAVFLLAGALANYGELYHRFILARFLSYDVAHLTFIAGSELLLTLFIFFDWFYTYVQITPEHILYARGMFLRKKTSIPLTQIEQVTHEYDILGKLLGYGTLIVHRGNSQGPLRLYYLATPQRYVDLILKFKKGNPGVSRSLPALPPLPQDLTEFLDREENENLEFKSTLRWDLRAAKVNRQLERMAMKTIAAFLNSGGGHLVLGVADGREVIGLTHDYKSLPRGDADGFENHFTSVFNNTIGAELRRFVKLNFARVGDKDICIVEVKPSTTPAYVRFDNSEEFYVRTGNSTTPLKVSEATAYIDVWRRRES